MQTSQFYPVVADQNNRRNQQAGIAVPLLPPNQYQSEGMYSYSPPSNGYQYPGEAYHHSLPVAQPVAFAPMQHVQHQHHQQHQPPAPPVQHVPQPYPVDVNGVGRWSDDLCACNKDFASTCSSIFITPFRWAKTMKRAQMATYKRAAFLMVIPWLILIACNGVSTTAVMRAHYKWRHHNSTRPFVPPPPPVNDEMHALDMWNAPQPPMIPISIGDDVPDVPVGVPADVEPIEPIAPEDPVDPDMPSTDPTTDDWNRDGKYHHRHHHKHGKHLRRVVNTAFAIAFAAAALIVITSCKYRGKLRAQSGIPGNWFFDFLTHAFCHVFAVAQEARHVDLATGHLVAVQYRRV